MANVQKDLGPVSAYAIAVKHGYNGTEEEWAALQIAAAGNAAAAASSAKAAADTLAAVGETVAQATGEAVQAVEAQEAESVKAVEEAAGAACTVQEEKIAQKGAETLASIPPEYADLVEQVNENTAGLLVTAPGIECELSGALVSTDDAAARPAVRIISHIEPVQAGTGDPSPENVRPISGWNSVRVNGTGKNLVTFPYYDVNRTVNGITFTVNNDGTITAQGTATANAVFNLSYPKLNAGAYCLSGGKSDNMRFVANKQKNGVDIAGVFDNGNGTTLVLDAQTVVHLYIVIIAGTTVNDTFAAQLESGSTATAYEPYQGQTLTAALPETIYGGMLDWNTGVLVSDWTITNLGDYEWKSEGNGLFWADVIEGEKFPAGAMVCSAYKVSAASNHTGTQNQEIWARYYAYGAKNVIIRNTAYTDASVFKAALDGVMLAYKMGTPKTYQLTPQQLDLLKGSNHLWSDCGGTDVTYIADTKLYIDNRIAAIAAAVINA